MSDSAAKRLAKYIDARHAGDKKPTGDTFAAPGAYGHNPHTGPIEPGDRDKAITSYIRLVVGKGHTRDEVEALVARRWRDMVQPKGNEYPLADAAAKIDRALKKFAPNPEAIEALAEGVTLPEELRERLKAKGVADEVARLQARREAAAIDREIEALKHPAPPVDFGTLDELLKRDDAERWRVEGLLPAEGNMLVVAQRKTGKTTLVNNLVRSLLTGEVFLGRFDTAPVEGSVMMLNYEVSGATFARWLGDLGLSKSARKRIHVVNLRGRENLLATEAGRITLAAMMRERRVEVLTVDPFGKAFTGDNQDSNSQVTPWLALLDRVANDGGAREVILVAHAGWGGGERGQASQVRARGASALEDWADAIVRYSRNNELDGAPRFIEAEGRDVFVEKDQLDYDAATRLLTATGLGGPGMARKATKVKALTEPILEVVKGTQGITASGIESALRRRGLSFVSGDHSAAITALVGSGKLLRFKDGNTRHHYTPGRVPPKFEGHESA